MTKDLQSHLDSLKQKLQTLQSRMEMINLDRQHVSKKIEEVNQDISNVKRKLRKVVITEHALLRYLERVMGISMEDMKAAIQKELPDYIPDGKWTAHGITFIVKDNTLVTTYKND